MNVGDRVRSKKHDLEGEIKEIGPCHHPDCGETGLTLDARGGGTRFFYHASSFEIVGNSQNSQGL